MSRWKSEAVAVGLAACGWLLSGALFLRGLALAGRGTALLARVLPAGCDEVLASRSSYQLGFPLAGWGLIYFALVGFLLVSQSDVARRAALWIVAAGFGASLMLTGALLSSGSACVLCLGVHSVNAALLAALWIVSGEDAGPLQIWRVSKAAAAKLLPVFFAMVLGASLQAGLSREDPGFRKSLANYEAAPRQPILTRNDDATLGPANAPVRIVVFSSFQCPACQEFNSYLQSIRRLYGDDVSVVFKHFPLGTECNPAVKVNMQPRSCAAAYAAEAARLQNAFWPYEENLFASSLAASDEILVNAARRSALDLRKWDADRHSPATMRKVTSDAQEGKSLAVDGTPGVFINEKRVRPTSRQMFGAIISHELAAQKKRARDIPLNAQAAR